MRCNHCGKTVFVRTEQRGPHIGFFCLSCGRWIKWASPEEKRLLGEHLDNMEKLNAQPVKYAANSCEAMYMED